MSQHEPQPPQNLLTRLRARDQTFASWLDDLRKTDPTFAQASVLQADSWGEWQAAVYLLTGSHEAWKTLGQRVLTERSIAPVVHEIDRPQRGWSSGEWTLLRWVAHLWNTGESEVSLPDVFDDEQFLRRINACHLHKRIAPSPGTPIEAER